MKKRISAFALVIAGVIIILGGCNMGGSVAARIAFEDRDATTLRAFSEKADLPPPDETLQPLRDFYSLLGNKVGSYTPSEFKLFIQEIVLYNDTAAIKLDEPLTVSSALDHSHHYADFTNDDIVLEPSTEVIPGTYTGMLFYFGVLAFNSVVSDGETEFTWELRPRIIVDLPSEYEGVWPDRERPPFPDLYDIEGLGGGEYVFVPWVLQPYFWITAGELEQQSVDFREGNETIHRIELFAYIKDSEYRAILPGIEGHPEIWDTGDDNTLGLPGTGYGSTGNPSALIMPFDGVTIPEDAGAVTFRIQWDLDGIVEIYDHGTSGDPSDDIVILAENFWERFSLVPEIN